MKGGREESAVVNEDFFSMSPYLHFSTMIIKLGIFDESVIISY